MDKKRGNELADQKSKANMKSRERWLLTRKTWRYMSDAGRKLFPEGISPHNQDDIAKIEEHFQNISKQCNEYVLWNQSLKDSKTSSPLHDSNTKFDFVNIDYDMRDENDQSYGLKTEITSTSGDMLSTLPSEIYTHLLKYYGASTLHHVASRILEEQLIEEDDLKYDEDDVEVIEVDGRLFRSVGIQTDPFLDMCIQTDETDVVKDHVIVGAETRAETEASVAYERALTHHRELVKKDCVLYQNELKQKYTNEEYDNIMQQQFNFIYQQELTKVQSHSSYGNVSAKSLQQISSDDYSIDEKDNYQLQTDRQCRKLSTVDLQQTIQRNQDIHNVLLQTSHNHCQSAPSQVPPQKVQTQQVHQPPVLKKFWARRESLTKVEIQLNQGSTNEKQRTVSIEKDKGMVAAKLASLEAAATYTSAQTINQLQKGQICTQSISSGTTVSTPKTTQQQLFTFNQKIQQPKHTEKKNQNVFKLGLKCDIDTNTGNTKKEVGKTKVDRFKTLNYDKTLRNIKSKWVPSKEEEAFIQSILNKSNKEKEVEIKYKERKSKENVKSHEFDTENKGNELEKKEKAKKKKARAIQVGEPLPQFILNSFRINSPVQIIHATKKRLRRMSSKSDSVYANEISKTTSVTSSPRYSITLLEQHNNRDLKVSESEAYKLLQMGIPFTCNFTPTEASSEDTEELPSQQQIHRSLSAIQVSGHIAQILHSIKGSRLHQSHFSGHPDKSRSLVQSVLQSLIPAVMQKGRSSGSDHVSRLIGKKMWRSRSKSQSRVSTDITSIWSPIGKSKWMSVTGKIVTLESTLLMNLSELERLSLQRISLSKLQAFNLGCQIKLPKEFSESSLKKKRPYLLKRKVLTPANKKDDIKDPLPGLVFGLPLNKCIENDKQRMAMERDSFYFGSPNINSIIDDGNLSRKSSQVGSNASFTSLLEGTKKSNAGSLENLNFERKRSSIGSSDFLLNRDQYSLPDMLTIVKEPQIPSIVLSCCRHIETYGLHTLGIFRVSPSKRRVKQLREEFDSEKEVLLTEENCPHEVASILKEFFRDLPDPLLSRELYEPFICTQKIRNRKQQLEALQFLVQLLPLPNRDTLYVLLNFLIKVAENAVDSIDKSGFDIPGNKMDSTNIATIFAPNILHQAKSGPEQLTAMEMRTNAMERGDIINVVRCMIDHSKELFEVTSDILNETYQSIMDNYPEALDSILLGRFAEPDEFDYELESSSSVFDGSEISSPVPLSPTQKGDFERSKNSPEMSSNHFYDDKGKIMSDDRQKTSDNKHIRRCSKGVLTTSTNCGSKLSSRIDVKEYRKSEMSSEEVIDNQSGTQLFLTRLGTKPMCGPTVRRMSSSEIDNCNTIRALLKIPISTNQTTSLPLPPESDIQHIQDLSTTCSRQRMGSDDSFLGQSITGTMSFQPISQMNIHKNSQDSLISSSSMGFYTMSPSERNTPNSEKHFMSGNSTPHSGITSSPLMWLSPDSGTPTFSPSSSPPIERKNIKRDYVPVQQHSYQTIHSSNFKPTPPQRSQSKGTIQRKFSASKSHISNSVKDSDSVQSIDNICKVNELHKKPEGSVKNKKSVLHTDYSRKCINKRFNDKLCHSGQVATLPKEQQQSSDVAHQVWKRSEIIASDPTETETYL